MSSQIIQTTAASPIPKNEHALKDSDIQTITENLENAHSIEDLLN